MKYIIAIIKGMLIGLAILIPGVSGGSMILTMEKEFPPEAKFTHPNGGLFTWVELPEYINTNEMAKQCLARNVAYVPGDGFYPDAGHNNCIRLNYSCMPEEKIVKGMTILGEVIKENLKK